MPTRLPPPDNTSIESRLCTKNTRKSAIPPFAVVNPRKPNTITVSGKKISSTEIQLRPPLPTDKDHFALCAQSHGESNELFYVQDRSPSLDYL